MDESKSKQGLGEVYEQEYVQQATGNTVVDKHEPQRREAVALFKALCAKLDALSSFHFAPRPVVEELSVKSDVPALVMEEVGGLAVSAASMRTPGETYAPEAAGEVKADKELSR